jgi:hypothetical protein
VARDAARRVDQNAIEIEKHRIARQLSHLHRH